ncbi:MAG: hypothetical protein SF070_16375 [Gemmatimonadota bacterium]|nr:hypothetical protein [Gemmatimonadota bacterium]
MLPLALALLVAPAAARDTTPPPDTLHLHVGSPAVNGRVYAPHVARVRVQVGDSGSAPTAEWTNELTLGDSAGRPVMRWITRGTQFAPNGNQVTWELRQTYDAVTLAPYAYQSRSSLGGYSRLTFDGPRIRGVRKLPADSVERAVDLTLDRAGFIASASDLVPLAAGLVQGRVMTAPFWSPGMTQSEVRIFTVLGQEPTLVEGKRWDAWKVEERRQADGRLLATWYLVTGSPYMVYGEVVLPDGRIQRMTEVEVATP